MAKPLDEALVACAITHAIKNVNSYLYKMCSTFSIFFQKQKGCGNTYELTINVMSGNEVLKTLGPVSIQGPTGVDFKTYLVAIFKQPPKFGDFRNKASYITCIYDNETAIFCNEDLMCLQVARKTLASYPGALDSLPFATL